LFAIFETFNKYENYEAVEVDKPISKQNEPPVPHNVSTFKQVTWL
jgi:hypothetical protein